MNTPKEESLKLNKRFELTLVWREDNQVKQIDRIEDNNLISLLNQFQFILMNVKDKIHEDIIRKLKEQFVDDDIPF